MVLHGAPLSNDVPTDSRHLSSIPRFIIWGGQMQSTAANLTKAFILEATQVEYGAEPDVYLPESEGVGNTVIKRPEIASQRNWQILDADILFPRNGIIVQWQVWVNEPGTARLQVYRQVPREGRAARMKHPYKLVGENVVTFKDTGFCPVHIVDRDQVEVQKGDVIGMRLDSDTFLLPGAPWPHRLQVLQCSAVWCRVVQSGAEWCSVVQCVAVCCSVLQCVAVCCNALHCIVVYCSVLQCFAVCCSVLQCVAVCCSVLQRVAACCSVLQRVAACCSVSRYVVLFRSVVQSVAVCCSLLQKRSTIMGAEACLTNTYMYT